MIGLADGCELMAHALAFPDEELAAALVDGSFASDAVGCLVDMGDEEGAQRAAKALAMYRDDRASDLFEQLRRACTVLFHVPGGNALLWPYEAAFLHAAQGREGLPALFRTPVQLDVERHMSQAGVRPKAARREPSDSAWSEFSFLSFLYGSLAEALCEDEASASSWRRAINEFWNEHGNRWLPALVERMELFCAEDERARVYGPVALMGVLVLARVSADVGA